MNRYEIRLVRLPGWALPLAGAAALALVALVALIGIALLAVLAPVLLVAGLLSRWRLRRRRSEVAGDFDRTSSRGPLVIEGEYDVVGETTQGRTPRSR